jgi:hypothetical protein
MLKDAFLYFVLLCFVIYVLVRLVHGRPASPSKRLVNLPNVRADNELLYRQLMHACMGDRPKVNRLIQYEKKRDPSISTPEAIQSAIDRLRIDRGRHN